MKVLWRYKDSFQTHPADLPAPLPHAGPKAQIVRAVVRLPLRVALLRLWPKNQAYGLAKYRDRAIAARAGGRWVEELRAAGKKRAAGLVWQILRPGHDPLVRWHRLGWPDLGHCGRRGHFGGLQLGQLRMVGLHHGAGHGLGVGPVAAMVGRGIVTDEQQGSADGAKWSLHSPMLRPSPALGEFARAHRAREH